MNKSNEFQKKVQEIILIHFDKFLEPCLKFLKSTRFIIDLVFQINFLIDWEEKERKEREERKEQERKEFLNIDKKEAFLNRDRKKQVKGDDELYLWYYLLLCFTAIWSMGGILTDKNDIKGEEFLLLVHTNLQKT